MPTNFAYSKAVKVIVIVGAMLISVAAVRAQGILYATAGIRYATANTGASVDVGELNFIGPITYPSPSDTPPPISSTDGVGITAETINLADVNFVSSVNLSSVTIVPAQLNFIIGVNYGGDSSGVEMIEANRSTAGFSEFSPIAPPPDFQIEPDQAGVILPVAAPEPSTLALGGLSLGLIALARLKKRSCA